MSDDKFITWWTGPYGQFSRRCEWPLTMTQAAKMAWDAKEEEITALRAEIERLRVENIQMQAALGYPIPADDERHIIPSNPYKCGTCDARRAEVERLRANLNKAHTRISTLASENTNLRKETREYSTQIIDLEEEVTQLKQGLAIAEARAALGGTDDTR